MSAGWVGVGEACGGFARCGLPGAGGVGDCDSVTGVVFSAGVVLNRIPGV